VMEPGHRGMLSLALLLCLSIGQVTPSCFGQDASWQTNAKPTVSQPSKNEPEKVMITWGNIIKNVKCVDKFFVWVWPDGTLKTGSAARKIEVDKNKISAIIDVEPCIGYRFALESEEDDMRKNFHSTSDILFKTQAIPGVRDLDKSKFTVGYHWDPVRHVSDLKLASIKFPKNLLKNANCLDYIQVTGSEVRSKPNLSRHSSTASMTGQVAWGHLGMERTGSRSSFTPSISAGLASTLPASVSRQVSGSSQSRGVSPPRGPLAKTYSSSSSVSTSSLPVGNSPFGAIEIPSYANTLARATSKGATKQVGPVRTQPPFLNDTIELLITAPDCAEFNFEVKMFAAKSKEIGKVQVHLPSLANIPSYVPPPVTEVMSISFSSGKPIYGVKTSSGVSAACLPAYFEASDSYRQRLENEIGYFAGKTDTGKNQISQTVGKSDNLDNQILKNHGCVCSSPVKFSTTDSSIEKEHPEFFGLYSYKAMHEGHPAYEKAGKKPMFLFYEKKKAQWLFGPTFGASSGVEYGSVEKGTAKCPADDAGWWMRKSSFLNRWKKEASLKVTCT